MKISTALTIALALIGLIGGASLTTQAIDAQRKAATVQTLRSLVATRVEWYDALITLSLERSLSQVLLASPETGYESLGKLLAKQRQDSDAKLIMAKKALDQAGDFALREELLGDIDQSLGVIADLRKEIDDLLALPQASRPAVTTARVITNLKDSIIAMRGISTHMVEPNDLASTQSTMLVRLQELAFELREYGGRARSLYAIATLHSLALSPTEIQYADLAMYRAKESWYEIEHIIETVDIPDQILADLTEVDQSFNHDLDALLTKLKKEMTATVTFATANNKGGAGPIHVPYSVPFDVYFQETATQLESASTLVQATGAALDGIWGELAEKERMMMIVEIALVFGLMAIMAATLWVVSRKVTRRLTKGLEDLAKLSDGALDGEIQRQRGDLAEISQLSDGLENLQTQLRHAAAARAELAHAEAAQKQIVDRLSYGLTELASGRLSIVLDDRFDEKYQKLADDFNTATRALSSVVAQVTETAETVLVGTRGINTATTELSQRTETQGATLQNAAAALEQLTRNIVGSQEDAKELDRSAVLVSEKSATMAVVMTQTVEAIEKIKSSSHQIEQIVGVIEDIAFQTNLLALNAGVEATRAGSEGSGFAVIASEVRGLAERSAQSAQDIKALIASSGVEVTKGVEYVTEAESAVGDMGAQFKTISDLISRIAAAAQEQSQGLVKVNDGIAQLDMVTQTNVAMVEETTAECANLATIAQDLSHLVAKFRSDGAGDVQFSSAA